MLLVLALSFSTERAAEVRRRRKIAVAPSCKFCPCKVRLILDRSQFGVYRPQIGAYTHAGLMQPTGLASALFSGVRQRVLGLIFGRPERSFYTSEIVRNVRSGTGAVERELSRLQRSGLVSVERIGNQKHFQANRQSPIFEELRSLVLKTVGLAEPLREALQPFSRKIKAAFVYGSVAKGVDTARSDIDLMVIGGDLAYTDLYDGLQKAESALHRQINPSFLSAEDWRRKLAQKNSFVAKISAQPKIFIFGSQDDLYL